MLLAADRSDGRELLERALRLAREAGLDGAAGRAFNNLVSAGRSSRNYHLAEQYVEPGIKFAQEHGLDLWLQLLSTTRIMLDVDRGCWQQAADAATLLV